jgi:hypothetical protein
MGIVVAIAVPAYARQDTVLIHQATVVAAAVNAAAVRVVDESCPWVLERNSHVQRCRDPWLVVALG